MTVIWSKQIVVKILFFSNDQDTSLAGLIVWTNKRCLLSVHNIVLSQKPLDVVTLHVLTKISTIFVILKQQFCLNVDKL